MLPPEVCCLASGSMAGGMGHPTVQMMGSSHGCMYAEQKTRLRPTQHMSLVLAMQKHACPCFSHPAGSPLRPGGRTSGDRARRIRIGGCTHMHQRQGLVCETPFPVCWLAHNISDQRNTHMPSCQFVKLLSYGMLLCTLGTRQG
jgi:hypothetical protein